MQIWSDAWWPDGLFERGVVGGLIVGLSFFVLVCLLRAAARIRTFGIWAYVKSALTIEEDSLGLFLVLLGILGVALLVFRRG